MWSVHFGATDAQVAGVPHGVANVSHGAYQSVQFVCSHPLLRAVSFVGSDRAGRYLYETASENGKRVQCNMVSDNSDDKRYC